MNRDAGSSWVQRLVRAFTSHKAKEFLLGESRRIPLSTDDFSNCSIAVIGGLSLQREKPPTVRELLGLPSSSSIPPCIHVVVEAECPCEVQLVVKPSESLLRCQQQQSPHNSSQEYDKYN